MEGRACPGHAGLQNRLCPAQWISLRLMYWPVDIPEAQSDLDDLTQTTLGSFAFTK